MTTDAEGFIKTGEVTLDSRRRASLGKFGVEPGTRYLISENDEGDVLLTPVVSVLASTLKNLASIQRGDPRYCPKALAGEPHDAHEYLYEYDRPEHLGGHTKGRYYCTGEPEFEPEPLQPGEDYHGREAIE